MCAFAANPDPRYERSRSGTTESQISLVAQLPQLPCRPRHPPRAAAAADADEPPQLSPVSSLPHLSPFPPCVSVESPKSFESSVRLTGLRHIVASVTMLSGVVSSSNKTTLRDTSWETKHER